MGASVRVRENVSTATGVRGRGFARDPTQVLKVCVCVWV